MIKLKRLILASGKRQILMIDKNNITCLYDHRRLSNCTGKKKKKRNTESVKSPEESSCNIIENSPTKLILNDKNNASKQIKINDFIANII